MPVRKSWDVLSKVNTHPRDTRIVFEEEAHRYTIDGDTDGWRSVTEVLKPFHEPFDSEKCVNSILNSFSYKNNTHRLSGKSKEEIMDSWVLENRRGTALHARMERSLNQQFHLKLRSNRHSSGDIMMEHVKAWFEDGSKIISMADRKREAYTFDPNEEFGDFSGTFLGYVWEDGTVRRNPLEDSELGQREPILSYTEALLETLQVSSFWKNHSTFEPYRSEWVVWDSDWKIAGTIDGVLKDKRDGSYWIFDWKRVRTGLEADLDVTRWGYVCRDDEWLEPVKPWVHKMPPPLEDLNATKYWNYSLQLNLYRAILEKNYGITIKGMKLIQFHPELGRKYQEHDVVRLEEPISRIL